MKPPFSRALRMALVSAAIVQAGLLRWIKRNVSFSPQPYIQLAKVFRERGFPDNSDDIIYASKAEERSPAWYYHEYMSWFGFSILQYTFGYGIGGYTFRVLL